LNPRNAILGALLAALLFGASTPFAKMLAGDVPPIMLAGLLYLGSGIGLWALRLLRVRHAPVPSLSVQDWMWFLIAVGVGGVLGPVLLMYGLQRTPASSASLLLNLEAVFTALIAWIGFRENTDRRLILGMLSHRCGRHGTGVATRAAGSGRVRRFRSRYGRLPVLGARQQPDAQGFGGGR
jgi:drug/metabolite transporter (DMT)-like permease